MKSIDIENDADLAKATGQAGMLIQAIHDYAGRDLKKKYKLRFPRGYLRTASSQRARLKFLPDGHHKDNIAYTLILADTAHWLLFRTDIAGTAREQLIKLHLFLIGSLTESITKIYLKGKCGKNYKERTKHLLNHNLITLEMKDDLDWIWDMRNNMHLFLVGNSEYQSPSYTEENYARAASVFDRLIDHLELL